MLKKQTDSGTASNENSLNANQRIDRFYALHHGNEEPELDQSHAAASKSNRMLEKMHRTNNNFNPSFDNSRGNLDMTLESQMMMMQPPKTAIGDDYEKPEKAETIHGLPSLRTNFSMQ